MGLIGVRTLCVQEGGGSRTLRTYCDWVVSNAEIDHLTQVNLCASLTSQEVQEGEGV